MSTWRTYPDATSREPGRSTFRAWRRPCAKLVMKGPSGWRRSRNGMPRPGPRAKSASMFRPDRIWACSAPRLSSGGPLFPVADPQVSMSPGLASWVRPYAGWVSPCCGLNRPPARESPGCGLKTASRPGRAWPNLLLAWNGFCSPASRPTCPPSTARITDPMLLMSKRERSSASPRYPPPAVRVIAPG